MFKVLHSMLLRPGRRDIAKRLIDLKPGQGAVLTLTDDSQYIAMHRDDFEHLTGLAGVKYEERPAPTVTHE